MDEREETEPTEVAVIAAPPSRGSALPAFVAVAGLVIASLGGPALVLAGVGRSTSAEAGPSATPDATSGATAVATRAAAGATTGATGRVRVVSATGRSRPIDSGAQHEITFSWILDGAREGDPVVVQVSAGNQSLGQQRGALDPSVFSFSSGTFTLMATLDCSTGGWYAEILTIRGQPVEGDSEATVAPVTCR